MSLETSRVRLGLLVALLALVALSLQFLRATDEGASSVGLRLHGRHVLHLLPVNGDCLHLDEALLPALRANARLSAQLLQLDARAADDRCARLIPVSAAPARHRTISEIYQYGNWCGVNYGGFEDANCAAICARNLEVPSPECVACRPPKDYLDEQCMLHDFCQERYALKNLTNYCADSFTFGSDLATGCDCSLLLVRQLRSSELLAKCDSGFCMLNGLLIGEGAGNILMPCTCKFCELDPRVSTTQCQEVYRCTTVAECDEFQPHNH